MHSGLHEGDLSITIDAGLDFAHVVIGGFFDKDAIERFKTARDEEYQNLYCASNVHVTLVDMREMRIQPQETVCGFATLLADPRWQSRRLAFVVDTTLARSQIIRAATGRNAASFTSVAEARSWLLENDRIIAA